MNSAFRQQPPFPLKKQAQALASKGRFGDTELVHMNPLEVDVLRSMTPNNQLTINPDTGQPEAFLPLLLALGGGILGAGATTGVLGTLGATGLAAIGSGLGTAIETGSLEEGLKAGLISGVLGGVGGRFVEGLGAAGGAAGGTAGAATGAGAGATATALQTGAGELPTFITQGVTEGAKQAAGEEVAKQTLREAFTSGLSQVANPSVFAPIAASGLTGQGMTEQFNMMNAPMPGMDDDDDFYVPVRLNDRGVRRRPRSMSGTSEFDYFANPFSFTPLRGFEDGGQVGIEPRGMFRGGRAAIEARENRGADAEPNGETFDPFAGDFAPTNLAIPSYFSNPFGSSAVQTSNLGQGLTDAQGNRQFNIIEDTTTEQIFTPRADDTQIALGTRGFADAPVIDYNRRLLGDPTRTITTQRRVDNPDFLGAAGTGTTTGTTAAGGTIPDDAFGGTTQIVTGGSEFNETFGMGEGVVSDLGTGQPDPYGTGAFVPPGSVPADVPGAYDPESGYMLPTGPDFQAAIDDYLAGVDFSSFVDAPPALDTSQFLTADDLVGFGPDTSQFLTAADLPTFDTSQFVTADDLTGFAPDTSQFLTAADLPTFDTSQFLTAGDLPTFDPVDTSQFLTAADLPTFDTSQFLTAGDLPTFNPVDTSQFLTAADLPTMDTSQFLTAADLPTMDTSQFLTAADLPTMDTSQFLTAADIPTLDTSQFLTAADLPTLDTSQFLTAADLPTMDTSQFLTAADLPTLDTSQFLTAADLPTIDTSGFLTSADLPTAFDPTGLQEQINTLSAAQTPAFDATDLQRQIASLSAQVAALNPAASAPVFSPTQPVMDFAIPRFAR